MLVVEYITYKGEETPTARRLNEVLRKLLLVHVKRKYWYFHRKIRFGSQRGHWTQIAL